MAVAYQRWLIAKGNVFAPSAPAVMKLVEQLRKEKWIVDPAGADLAKLRFEGQAASRAKATGGYAVKTVENAFGDDDEAKILASAEAQPAELTKDWLDDAEREELRLVWPVAGDASLPLTYPLSLRPEGNVSYAIELHRALEYVYPTSDTIDLIPTVCRCSEDLSFEWDEDEVVGAFGAATGIFAECDECSRTFDPSKGEALVTNPFDATTETVSGGAAYRFALKVDCGPCFVKDPRLAFAPELVALVEKEFGRAFYEVGSLG